MFRTSTEITTGIVILPAYPQIATKHFM